VRETSIQNAIRLALGSLPHVLVVRRNVGRFVAVGGNVQAAAALLRKYGFAASVVEIGTEGEADLQGLVGGQRCRICGEPQHPKPFALEVKSATGDLRPEQIRWAREVWQRRGGTYAVVRSPAEALQALDLLQEGNP
jgi:hypothetical protein